MILSGGSLGELPPAHPQGMKITVDRTERYYKIDPLMQTRRAAVPVGAFLDELEVSLATFKGDIEYLRSRHHAPIEWARDAGGYRFVKPDGAAPAYELPGALWFSPREAQALLTMQHLLESLGPTLLGAHLALLKSRLGYNVEVLSPSSLRAEIRSRVTALLCEIRKAA